jgi:hypothetical protein
MMFHRGIGAVAVVITVVLAACSSGPENDADNPAPVDPGAAAPNVAGQPIGHASAADTEGDGEDADLLSVTLDGNATGLAVKYELGSKLPSFGTALLVIYATTPSGDQSWQLGLKYIDGESNVFVFDMTTAAQENVDATPQVVASAVSVNYPAKSVMALGPSFKWRAVSNIDGADVDACPDLGTEILSPVTVNFPGA